MMEHKITPGPWTAIRRTVGWVLSGPEGSYNCEASFVMPLNLQVYGPDWEHNKACSGNGSDFICGNALLIAAAPDMLAALQEVKRCGNAGARLSRDASKLVRAALAKAEGR